MRLKLEQIGIVVLLLCIPIFLYFYVTSKSEIMINGQVINFGAKVDDTGIHSFLMVKLDDNKIIKVNYNKASKFDIGKIVIINEKTTNFFAIKRYTLSRITKQRSERGTHGLKR